MTTATFAKTITFDRVSKDFRMELDGRLIGYARTKHEADVTLDAVVREMLIHGDCATASELDGDADVEAQAADYQASIAEATTWDATPALVNWNSATAQIDPATAFTAQSLANRIQSPAYVLMQHGHYLIQDDADLDCYGGRAAIVATYQPLACDPPGPNPEDDSEGDRDEPDRPRSIPTYACTVARLCTNPRHDHTHYAVTLQSIAIESRLTVCGYCQGIHHAQQCPTLRQALRSERWTGADLGRGLCQLLWRNHADFVDLLASVTPARLVEYAESYIAFLHAYRGDNCATVHEVLAVWMREMGGDRGPAAPALRMAA